jgi:hypothetical protein
MDALPLPNKLTYREMAALYDALRTMKEVGLGLISQARFTGDQGLYNEAGNILDDLCDLIGKTTDDLAEMALKARPDPRSQSYSADFADRAHVLIAHENNCNGIESAAVQAFGLYPQDLVI